MGSLILFQTGSSSVFAVPEFLAAEIQAHAKIVALEHNQVFVLDHPVKKLTMENENAKSERV